MAFVIVHDVLCLWFVYLFVINDVPGECTTGTAVHLLQWLLLYAELEEQSD